MESPSQTSPSAARVSTQSVRNLYEAKTAAIIRRYGPGPKVHYHTGFADEPRPWATSAALRMQLVESQERMLSYASRSWDFRSIQFHDVLDVGCGLGGTAIYLAEEFGARVTAITIAPSHLDLINGFAKEAGVGSRVSPLLCDASAVPGESCFDAAIALESSSLFPRRSWFQCLARVMRPGARIFLFDCFLEGSRYEETFNRHWCAQIGTAEEYVEAAREAGLNLDAIEDTSLRTATFWRTTLQLIGTEANEMKLDPTRLRVAKESFETHQVMYQGLVEGGLRQLMMTFLKP